MADIRDIGAFIRGRWDWHRLGYERAFPRGCGFTDIDAAVEFDGRFLLIETKQHDGDGSCEYPPAGQLSALRQEARLGKAVLVLYGCASCNNPQAVRRIGPNPNRSSDAWLDWRHLPREERRRLLKAEIDNAMGLRTITHIYEREEPA